MFRKKVATQGWVFQQEGFQSQNPSIDLAIMDISKGRDDFSHAGFRMTTWEKIFDFDLGRPTDRPLTWIERVMNPGYDYACTWQIVDRQISREQRQLVLQWLQSTEDGIVASLQEAGRDRRRALMMLKTVRGIDGY